MDETPVTGGMDEPPRFFVSYTHSDQRWAEWIGWVVEAAGYPVMLQAWDFGVGSHFVAEMHEATRRAVRTIAVLSQAYQASVYASAEWQAAWGADPDGRARRLVVVRVEDCAREGLLHQVVGVDLFGVDRDIARQRLLDAVRGGRRKPDSEPDFPEGRAGDRGEPPLPRPAAVWRMAWPRNPNFVGRVEDLALLWEQFAGGSAMTAVLPQALQGLGGVGKTQLAVEYAYRHAADYELVWWLSAEDSALIVAGLAELAARLGIAVTGQAQESAEAVGELLRRGERFTRWLVIADNADEVSDLAGLVHAAGGGGHVLITSRDPGWAEAARAVEVDVLSRAEAVALLQARAPRLAAVEAERVAAVLGDLPLAVEQAGAWLRSSGMSVADYLDAVERRAGVILAEGKPRSHPVPVAATWTVAVETLDDPATVWLLRLWAFLGPEPIPTDLITADSVTVLPAVMAPLGDPVVRGRSIQTLTRLGLVKHTPDGVVMHRLVHAVLRHHTPAADQAALTASLPELLLSATPDEVEDPAAWPRWATIYTHAMAFDIANYDSNAASTLALDLSAYLRGVGNYSASHQLAERLHDRRKQVLGRDHLDTIGAANNLGLTLSSMGDYPAARTLQEDVLTRFRQVLGPDHPDTIGAANNLGGTLYGMGDYPAARTLLEDVLTRSRQVLGPDHPNTISAANNLGGTLSSMGDYPAARTLQEDVLTRFRQVLGPDHPDTIGAANNLGGTLYGMGDYPAARTLQEDVLTRSRQVLGPDHPNTISAANNLGGTLSSMGTTPPPAPSKRTCSPAGGRSWAPTTPTPSARPTTSATPCTAWGTTPPPAPSKRTCSPAFGTSWAPTTPTPSARPTTSAAPCTAWGTTPPPAPSKRTCSPAVGRFWAPTTPTPSARPTTSAAPCTAWGTTPPPAPSKRTCSPAGGRSWAPTTPTPSARPTTSAAPCTAWGTTPPPAPSKRTCSPAGGRSWAPTTPTPSSRPTTSA